MPIHIPGVTARVAGSTLGRENTRSLIDGFFIKARQFSELVQSQFDKQLGFRSV